jgi:hypothetical protein
MIFSVSHPSADAPSNAASTRILVFPFGLGLPTIATIFTYFLQGISSPFRKELVLSLSKERFKGI